MSWFDRRGMLAVLALGAIGPACGFRPAYQPIGAVAPGASAQAMQVAQPPGRAGYYYARALRRSLRVQGGVGAALRIESRLSFEERETAITVDDDVTRIAVTGRVAWRALDGDREISRGEERATSGYTTIAAPFAVRTAADEAERRIAEALAQRVFLALLAAPELAGTT
jgi:Predicted secreted (periplasmic) protein (DUF2159).